jgi:hypothetical protein
MGKTHSTDHTPKKLKEVPLDNRKKISLSSNIDEDKIFLTHKLTKRVGESKDVMPTEEKLADLSNSVTGCVAYFIIKELEKEFRIGFEKDPRSLKMYGILGDYDNKIATKKRLPKREKKNKLTAKISISYYEVKIVSGEMTIENAMFAVKDAYGRKKGFEEMGYILPPEKTKFPYWLGEEMENEGD